MRTRAMFAKVWWMNSVTVTGRLFCIGVLHKFSDLGGEIDKDGGGRLHCQDSRHDGIGADRR